MRALTLFLLSFQVYAQNGVLLNEGDYSFNHPTCLLRFNESIEFGEQAAESLRAKGYKLHSFLPEEKLNPEDMYFVLEIERKGILFKDCHLSYYIAQASSVKPTMADKRLLSAKTTRSLPRVTLSGDERCRRGLDDLFVNLPACRSGKSLQQVSKPLEAHDQVE